jgi:RNA polymerase sigma factor (sigma-70 family)
MFERHGRMVYGISRATLRDPHEAEDATQQAFLSAYRSLLGGADVRDEGAWLATIARNECRARIAAGMRTPLPVADEDLEAIPATGDEAERRAQVEALCAALTALPERQREAVVLRHLYGLSYGEVGRALGLSRPATEALLFRARRAMRMRLRPAVATAIAVPLSVQEGLAEAIPGFGSVSAGALVGGAAGGGILAKLASAPVAAKVATAAVAVTTVGAVGAMESERASRDRAEHGGLVRSMGQRPADDAAVRDVSSGESGSRASGSGDERAGEDDSGPGSANSGAGSVSSGSGSGDDGRQLEDEHSSSGKGSGDEPSSSDGSDDHSGSGSGDEGDDDSGKGGSSGSGSSGSSGSGSGSSGSGSGDDGGSGSSGSGDDDSSGSDSSGSGSGGGGDDGSGGDDEPDD